MTPALMRTWRRPWRRQGDYSTALSAVAVELIRRENLGYPGITSTPEQVEEAVVRWADPEVVDRSMVREALWEMERHYWPAPGVGDCTCVCGKDIGTPTTPKQILMSHHKQDILAAMLGLTIKPEAS